MLSKIGFVLEGSERCEWRRKRVMVGEHRLCGGVLLRLHQAERVAEDRFERGLGERSFRRSTSVDFSLDLIGVLLATAR
jgi:hypothetical protein